MRNLPDIHQLALIPVRKVTLGEDALHALLNAASIQLGGDALTPEQFELGRHPYNGFSRFFHGWAHGKSMSFMTPAETEALGEAFGNKKAAYKIAPLITLAGFYHDDVYTQVDGDVTPAIQTILNKYTTRNQDGSYTLHDNANAQDQKILNLVATIFNVTPGETLPPPQKQAIQNEFLSALVQAHEMSGMGHTLATIAQSVTITEATIPFRDENRFTPLQERLETANQLFNLGLSEQDVDYTLKAAVFEANKDVFGFAGNLEETALERFRVFIQGTWRLLPEMSPRLRGINYTPQDYRKTMQGNHFFLIQLLGTNPKMKVFHAHDGYPSVEGMNMLSAHEQEIRKTADIYLKCKTVSAALVEAIARASDIAPDITLPDLVKGSENYLPLPENPGHVTSEAGQIAWEVLRHGRGDTTLFDISPSPIAAYLLAYLGEAKMSNLFTLVATHLKPNEENYPQFLIESAKEMGGEAFPNVAIALEKTATGQLNYGRAENIASAKNIILQKARGILPPVDSAMHIG